MKKLLLLPSFSRLVHALFRQVLRLSFSTLLVVQFQPGIVTLRPLTKNIQVFEGHATQLAPPTFSLPHLDLSFLPMFLISRAVAFQNWFSSS